MKKARFGFDWLLEAGDANVCHRYWFLIELEDEFYEELYQVWFDRCQGGARGTEVSGIICIIDMHLSHIFDKGELGSFDNRKLTTPLQSH